MREGREEGGEGGRGGGRRGKRKGNGKGERRKGRGKGKGRKDKPAQQELNFNKSKENFFLFNCKARVRKEKRRKGEKK